jgi:hypothetical protein
MRSGPFDGAERFGAEWHRQIPFEVEGPSHAFALAHRHPVEDGEQGWVERRDSVPLPTLFSWVSVSCHHHPNGLWDVSDEGRPARSLKMGTRGSIEIAKSCLKTKVYLKRCKVTFRN